MVNKDYAVQLVWPIQNVIEIERKMCRVKKTLQNFTKM